MIRLYLTVSSLLLLTRDRATARLQQDGDDTGSVSLEQVVVALGLFLLAAIVVAVITGAAQSRLNQIN